MCGTVRLALAFLVYRRTQQPFLPWHYLKTSSGFTLPAKTALSTSGVSHLCLECRVLKSSLSTPQPRFPRKLCSHWTLTIVKQLLLLLQKNQQESLNRLTRPQLASLQLPNRNMLNPFCQVLLEFLPPNSSSPLCKLLLRRQCLMCCLECAQMPA